MSEEKTERKIVVPGETLIQGEEFLPGEGTRREGKDIVANKFGLVDITDRFVKIIPLSGVYQPRRGNAIIGQVIDVTFNGWIISFGAAQNGFLSMMEVPRFINKDELREQFDFGDAVLAKVWDVKAKGIDLSVKMRGFGRLDGGMIIKVNPNKVPRIIGKEGSMVKLIKDYLNCEICVGQNGWVWVSGDKVEDEINAKDIINFICENSFVSGLTEKVEEYIEKNLKIKIIKQKEEKNE